MKSIVVHYQEIALKGKNRPWFVARLVRNIREAVKGLDVTAVRLLMWRMGVRPRAGTLGAVGRCPGPGTRGDAAQHRLSTVFGIGNFARAGRVPLDVDAIAAEILKDLGPENPPTFRVSARRADKRFTLTSQ